MVLPVDHVCGCIQKPVLHLEALGIVLVMSCVEIDCVAMYIGCGVGCVFCLDDRKIEPLPVLAYCGYSHKQHEG